jgi:hypothetical protein
MRCVLFAVVLLSAAAVLSVDAQPGGIISSPIDPRSGLVIPPTNFPAHNTASFRDANGGPVKRFAILRRNQSFTVLLPTATPSTKYFLEVQGASSRGYGSSTEKIELTVKGARVQGRAELEHQQGALGLFTLVAEDNGRKLGSAPVAFLANPYRATDETYIGSSSGANKDVFPPDMAEHVENEKGALWQGSATQNSWVAWAFNQYDVAVLETALELLNGLSTKQRASTALVVRWLTLKAQDVLRGRWDGNYKDGKQPGYWASTTQIISQYRATKQTVKYGQVSCALAVSLSRARSLSLSLSRPLSLCPL